MQNREKLIQRIEYLTEYGCCLRRLMLTGSLTLPVLYCLMVLSDHDSGFRGRRQIFLRDLEQAKTKGTNDGMAFKRQTA